MQNAAVKEASHQVASLEIIFSTLPIGLYVDVGYRGISWFFW